MKQLNEILVSPETSILQGIETIDSSALQILLVVDGAGRLLGSVTDGDVRRAILHGRDLNESVSVVMNPNPISVLEGTTRDVVLSLMQAKSIHCVPVVDKEGHVVGLETQSRLLWQGVEDDTCVVLMAGGLGMRLRPLTESVPKPLLEVNGKAMLEHIIERFVEQGFKRFYLSVNYKSEMIRQHFGDGADFGAHISYIDEDKPLGTGGALSQLPTECMSDNIIVMNGDLLTTLNFRQLLDFHNVHSGCATMCVRDYSIQVPYGVVAVEGEHFIDIIEKPAHSYFVNAGVYVIRSDELKHIPSDRFYDLPDLFSQLKEQGKKVTVFPLREDWRDIGNIHEFQQAQGEVNT